MATAPQTTGLVLLVVYACGTHIRLETARLQSTSTGQWSSSVTVRWCPLLPGDPISFPARDLSLSMVRVDQRFPRSQLYGDRSQEKKKGPSVTLWRRTYREKQFVES